MWRLVEGALRLSDADRPVGRSWFKACHFYWSDASKTQMMCNGYQVPDEYIEFIEQKHGPIDIGRI